MTAREYLESWSSHNVKPVAYAARRDEANGLADLCVRGAKLFGFTEEQLESAATMDVESYIDERIDAANWELMDEVLTRRN